jgi:SAM-dependent methyltransferase
VARYGGLVLELACGTGRLAIPIAADGPEVFALDASLQMLTRAEQKSADLGAKVRWIRGDLRRLDLNRRFGCILAASNSPSHLYSRPDIERCLACVRHHLTASGRFVFDLFNPALGLLNQPAGYRFPVARYQDSAGTPVSVSKAVHYDSSTQVSHETWYFRDEVTGEEQSAPLHLRMFFPPEIDSLLHYNGFSIQQKFGDYDEAAPFTSSSRRQIIVCARAKTPCF